MKPDIPEFCDFDCPFAAFPPADTAGICRTMSAVWCRQLKELVNKNVPCEWRRRDGARRERAAQHNTPVQRGRAARRSAPARRGGTPRRGGKSS